MIRYLLSGLLLCLVFSCEDPDLVGSAVMPVSDQPGVYFTDTTSVVVRTLREDSLIGSYNSSPLFLGSMNDIEIGNSAASFYIQIRLGNSLANVGFNGVTKPDSVVLSFGYKTIYGDSAAMHHISVYEIDEIMDLKDTVYTTTDFALKSNGGMGYTSLIPNLKDSVLLGGVKAAPQLRLHISNEWGAKIMEHYLRSPATFSSNSEFQEYFNGIYLVDSADGNGSILTLDPNSSLNALTIYYKRTPDDNFSSSYNFKINDFSARNNRFKHQYNPIIFDTVQPPVLYLQSMAGLKAKIEFPNLMNLSKNQAVSINKAEIVVKLKSGSYTSLANHTLLSIYAPDSLGRNTLILDYFEDNNVFGDVFLNNECRLDISRHLQSVLKGGRKNYGIYIAGFGPTSNARRTLLDGAGSVKLNLTYTLQNK